jgi:hypothetical protein
MKESKQPDGPQVVDPKADRAQKMPIASHKEDSLRPKEKTTSEEFKDFGGASDELRQKLEKRKKATEEHTIVTVQNPSTQPQLPSAHYPIARLRTDSIGHKRPSKEERRLRSMTITGDAKSFFRDLGRESGESDELRAKLSKWKKQADTNVFTSSAKDPGSTS